MTFVFKTNRIMMHLRSKTNVNKCCVNVGQITFALRQIQINEPNCKQMCSNFVKQHICMDKYRANVTLVKWVFQASTHVPFSLFFPGIYPFIASSNLPLTLHVAFNLSLKWTSQGKYHRSSFNSTKIGQVERPSIFSLFPLITTFTWNPDITKILLKL